VKYQLGAFVLLAASTDASAQSSVTLYGRVDGDVEYLNHIANGTGGSSSRWSAEGGDWGTSMLGFKGTEDVGGGTSALFDLETALQIMNGTTGGGKMFSRRAYVGLKNETWGQLQSGRNLFIRSPSGATSRSRRYRFARAGSLADFPLSQRRRVGIRSVRAAGGLSASLVRGRNWQQTSNNVEYHSPIWHGLDVQGQYAFGNQASGFNNGAAGDFGRSDGIMLSYHSPLFDLRGIYDELRDSNGRFSNIFTASREYFVGANVRVQKFKIQAVYTHYAAPDSPAGVADSADHYWLGTTYQATPRWAVTAAAFYIRVGDSGGDVSIRAARDACCARNHLQPERAYVPVRHCRVREQQQKRHLLGVRDAARFELADEPDGRRIALDAAVPDLRTARTSE
jgi:predicted porin